MEIVGFSDHRATADVWYRLLNCGLPPPGRLRDRRHDELRVAARAGRDEPRLRDGGRQARLRAPGSRRSRRAARSRRTGRSCPSAWTATRSATRSGSPAGRHALTATGEPALDRARSRSSRSSATAASSRRFRSYAEERGPTRRSRCPVGPEAAGTRCGPGRPTPSSPCSTSIRSRRRARSTSPWTASRSAARRTLAVLRGLDRPRRGGRVRRTRAGTTRRRRRTCSRDSTPRRPSFVRLASEAP